MSTYTIEEGIPLPFGKRGNGGARRGCTTEWSKTLDALEPGQSTLTGNYTDVKRAEIFRYYRPERKFATRKIPGEGWRVWRTE